MQFNTLTAVRTYMIISENFSQTNQPFIHKSRQIHQNVVKTSNSIQSFEVRLPMITKVTNGELVELRASYRMVI